MHGPMNVKFDNGMTSTKMSLPFCFVIHFRKSRV